MRLHIPGSALFQYGLQSNSDDYNGLCFLKPASEKIKRAPEGSSKFLDCFVQYVIPYKHAHSYFIKYVLNF